MIAAGVLVAVLVVGQLTLPGLAARRLRSDLQADGSGVHVDVAAFPAIKLLWHRADRVTLTIADYHSDSGGTGASLPDLLAQTKDTGKLDVHVRVLEDRLLRMQDVRLHKDGDVLTAQVEVRRSDADAALPAELHLTGRHVADGLSVAGVTSVFGERVEADASIVVEHGSIVLRPEGFPLASLVSVPIFSDKRVAVDAISAATTADGFSITAHGHLRR
jgi:hypothetical protein